MAAMLVGSSTTHTSRWLRVGLRAIDAGIDVGDVVADRAQVQAGLHLADGVGEQFGVFVAGAQDVKGEALRRLAAHAGQLLQFFNQSSHRLGESGHYLTCVHHGDTRYRG